MSLALLEAPAAARVNIYADIHKGVRLALCQTLIQLAKVDAADEAEVSDALRDVRDLLGLCAIHLRHEDAFVHPAMEARRPGSAAGTGADHRHHEEEIEALRGLADLAASVSGAARGAVLDRLHAKLCLFTAENLAHMAMEESVNNAVLQDAYSDGEILAIEGALVASLTPEEMGLAMRWMIPALNPQERAAKFAGIREKAPEPAFRGLLALARMRLSARDWAKLAAALDLPAAER